MKILYIWDADYPWDVRVEKICRTLAKHGHEVHIAARNLKRSAEYEKQEDMHIHRLKPLSGNKTNYAFSFPLFFSPFWKNHFDRIILEHCIKLIIVRDLPMAIAAIWTGKRHRIPVIFDMAEDYVAMLWDIWKASKFQGFNIIVRNPYFAKKVERYVLRNIDHILVVVEEARDIVLRSGRNETNITIVGNTPLLESFNCDGTAMNGVLKMVRDRYSAIYTGGIQMGRGIQVVIEAIPEIINKIPEFLLVVVGKGYALERLKKLANDHGLQNYVMWVGWVDHAKIFDYIRASKVGIIPHLVTDHINSTIPNKLFDYMALGLPVISSDASPIKRILKEEKCGITFQSGNAEAFAKSIITIFNTKIDYGKNGKIAVKNKYNWKYDKERLQSAVYETAIKYHHYLRSNL